MTATLRSGNTTVSTTSRYVSVTVPPTPTPVPTPPPQTPPVHVPLPPPTPPTPPFAPPARVLTPDVTSGNGNLAVSWTEPSEQGTSQITLYEVQHKASSQTNWSNSSTPTTYTTLSGLTNTFAYHVRVRACIGDGGSDSGCGDWSFHESATPSASPGPLPGIPTGLSANGNIVSGDVSLWWNSSTDAVDYNLRYAVETCTNTSQGTASACSAGEWNEVNGIAAIRKTLSAGSGSTNQLVPSTVYRLKVRATNAYGQSSWSDIAFVYPTTSPPQASRHPILTVPYFESRPPLIATGPLYGYQPTNSQGIHEFNYIICAATIPTGVTLTASQIARAIEKWEETVKKDSSGNSMILTTGAVRSTPAPDGACEPPRSAALGLPIAVFPTGHNELMFVSRVTVFRVLCGAAPACWRSSTWDTTSIRARLGTVGSLSSIAKGTILLNASRGAFYWNTLAHNNACKRAEHTITHEVGHALGIGWPVNNHPENPTLSIMSDGYAHHTRYCEPQAYDIVSVLANYQSR